jgi:hypothetical protein
LDLLSAAGESGRALAVSPGGELAEALSAGAEAAGSVAAYETTPDPVPIVASLARALGLGDGDQAQGAVLVAPVRAQQTGRFYRSRDLGAATIDASLRRGDQGLDSLRRQRPGEPAPWGQPSPQCGRRRP